MRGSVRRRSKDSWELTIDIGRGSDGKRKRKFIHVKGKRTDADRKLREVMAALDRGLPPDTSNLTVTEYLDRWYIGYVTVNTRPLTAQKYRGDIENHIKPAIGVVRLSQLRPLDIERMKGEVAGKGLSSSTQRHTFRVLHVALKHALRDGLIYANPVDAVTPPKVSRKPVQPPTIREMETILDAAKDTPYWPTLVFMSRTGVRRGECLALKWNDINLDSRIVSVSRSLQRIPGMGLSFEPVKSDASRRAIAIDLETTDMLRNHRGAQVLVEAALIGTYDQQGLVFPGPRGKPLDPSVITRNFEKLVRSLGLRHVRLHDLRHFHASTLLRGNVHLRIVQARLGHSSIAITADTYSHLAPSMDREAADIFQAVVTQARVSAR